MSGVIPLGAVGSAGKICCTVVRTIPCAEPEHSSLCSIIANGRWSSHGLRQGRVLGRVIRDGACGGGANARWCKSRGHVLAHQCDIAMPSFLSSLRSMWLEWSCTLSDAGLLPASAE